MEKKLDNLLFPKAWEAYEKIVKKRNEAYQLMLMTRKDNKDKVEVGQNSIQKFYLLLIMMKKNSPINILY